MISQKNSNRNLIALALGFASAGVLATSASAATMVSYQLYLSGNDAGAITGGELTNSAAHEAGLTDSVWNSYQLDSTPPSGVTEFDQSAGANNVLVDGLGNDNGVSFRYSEGITGVNFANGFTAGATNGPEDTTNPGDSGTNGNALYQEVWFTRPGDLGQGFQFKGLEAGSYDVYVYATESNNSNRSYDVTFQADSDDISSQGDGISNGISTGNNTGAYIDGLNYTVQTIDIAAGENLVVFISAESNGAESFSSIGAIQLVGEVPEPSSLALIGLGGLLIARRRRG